MKRLDVRSFIMHLGGPAAVGIIVGGSRDTPYKCCKRNSIGSAYLNRILENAHMFPAFNLNDFIVDKK